MPNSSANKPFVSPLIHGDNQSVLSNPSVFHDYYDLKTAELKLNAKIQLIDKYLDKCDKNFIMQLTESDYEKRLKFMEHQVNYLSDILDFAFLNGDENLQELSAEYLDKVQTLVENMKEIRSSLSFEANSKNFICDDTNAVTNANVALAESYINHIALITREVIDNTCSESRLKSLLVTDIPYLEKKVESMNKLCKDLSSDELRYANIICKLSHAIVKADNWILESMIIIKFMKIDLVDDSKTFTEPIKIKPFDGWKSDSNIFDFLSEFERVYCTAKQSTKLTALFKNCLSSNIASEVSHYYANNDYNGIISYLLSKYGNARRIVNAKKSQLTELKYSLKDVEVQTLYLRSYYQCLIGLEALVKAHSDKVNDLGNEIYNQSFLQHLTMVLPDYHKRRVLKELSKAERDNHGQLSDKQEFEVIKNYIFVELSDLEYAISKCPSLIDGKKSHSEINYVQSETAYASSQRQKNFVNKNTNSNIRIKCFMHDILADPYSHSIGKCKVFCQAMPKVRFDKVKDHSLCVTCLSDRCNGTENICNNISNVPSNLICSICKESCPSKPKNVLVCSDHNKDVKDILSKLDYITGFKPGTYVQLHQVNNSKVDFNLNHIDFHSMNVQDVIKPIVRKSKPNKKFKSTNQQSANVIDSNFSRKYNSYYSYRNFMYPFLIFCCFAQVVSSSTNNSAPKFFDMSKVNQNTPQLSPRNFQFSSYDFIHYTNFETYFYSDYSSIVPYRDKTPIYYNLKPTVGLFFLSGDTTLSFSVLRGYYPKFQHSQGKLFQPCSPDFQGKLPCLHECQGILPCVPAQHVLQVDCITTQNESTTLGPAVLYILSRRFV